MTPEERTRMNFLCKRIQEEHNPKVFDDLVVELNDLLEAKHGRIHPDHKVGPADSPMSGNQTQQ